jgi:S-adenosylmethionine synthetase
MSCRPVTSGSVTEGHPDTSADRIGRAVATVLDPRPVHTRTAAHGHVGRSLPAFGRARTDRARVLRTAAGA